MSGIEAGDREGRVNQRFGDACLDPVMTLTEAAGYLKVSLTTIKTIIREGHLSITLVGADPRVLRDDIDEFLRVRRRVVDTKATTAARREDPQAPRIYRPALDAGATIHFAQSAGRQAYRTHFKDLFAEESKCESG